MLIRNYGTDPTLTGMLDRAVYYIVPLSNPDGYVYTWTTDRLWRKNRRTNGGGSFGVDLNRNWGYQWGASFPTFITGRPLSPSRRPSVSGISDSHIRRSSRTYIF